MYRRSHSQLKSHIVSKLPRGSYPDFLIEVDENDLSTIAHAKRFVERHIADPKFRDLAADDCRKAARLYDIDIDPDEIRTLWDPEAGRKYIKEGTQLTPTLKLCQRYSAAMTGWMRRRRASGSLSQPNFRYWWERQLARNSSEIGMAVNTRDVHAPVCIELSDGCTVGCWFCAISADRFRGAFEYTPANRQLWHEVLRSIRDIIGPAADVGFCYWATEPFDNPEYEEFIKDYHAIVGSMPSTTTARAHKDIPRARLLLHLWEDYGFTYNQWSILSIKILDKIHSEFSPEELVWTKLCMLNKESIVKKANAGRALERLKRQVANGESVDEILDELAQGTIACVTGFLINMVEKRIRLISPCKASDRWPKGYKVYDESVFTDGLEARSIMDSMIARNMLTKPPGGQPIRFRCDLSYRRLADGFELATEFRSEKAQHPLYGTMLGEMINTGAYTYDQIVAAIHDQGPSREDIEVAIDTLFMKGLLEEQMHT